MKNKNKNKNKILIFLGLILFQIFLIFISLFYFSYFFQKEILLKLQPIIDPRSLFQGNYLFLNYEISYLRKNSYQGPQDFSPGERIFVILKKVNEHYSAKAVSKTLPKDEVFLKGKVFSNYGGNVRIIYGIETYFVPENKAREIERKLREFQRKTDIYVKVKVDNKGNALVKEILVGETKINLLDTKKAEKEIENLIKKRDRKRIAGIQNLAQALDEFYKDHGFYPVSLSYLSPKYLSEIPRDPQTGQDYFYAYYPSFEPFAYHLGARLEGERFELKKDDDFDSKRVGFVNGFNGEDPIYDFHRVKFIEKPQKASRIFSFLAERFCIISGNEWTDTRLSSKACNEYCKKIGFSKGILLTSGKKFCAGPMCSYVADFSTCEIEKISNDGKCGCVSEFICKCE